MSSKSEKTCTVEFQPLGRRIEAPFETTIAQAAQSAGVPLAADCGGKGKCGKCRVHILAGGAAPPDSSELKVLEQSSAAPQERLACMTRILGDVKIHVPKASMVHEQSLQLEGRMRSPDGDRLVQSRFVNLPLPNLQDQRSDSRRLSEAMDAWDENGWTLSPEFVRRLSGSLRESNGELTVFLQDGAPIGLIAGKKTPIGAAFDLGTTTIAGRLVDLETGEILCSEGCMNPQISYGEDVISRLDYAIHNPDGPGRLSAAAKDAINDLLSALCKNAGVEPERVSNISVACNTAMSHLLLKLPASPLARSPYAAGFSNPLELTGKAFGIKDAPTAKVYVFPCIEGFVGGDHTAMILACGLDQADETCLGVDIGTNTEIVLTRPGADGGMFVTSCASGPALEGAHVRDGMRASPGAIHKVRITENGPEIFTINNEPPVGICGSGLVDALAEMVRAGVLDSRGHFTYEAKGVHKSPRGKYYLLATKEKDQAKQDIIITQKDISELQLAKGAIHAGVQKLLQQMGISAKEISRVYMAGAFGSHLNMESALAIRLLPEDLADAEFVQAGNAAADGACLALLSRRERSRAEKIARNAVHVEMANDSSFSSVLVKAMRF
ncbi:ASKHA domain-containing protein [Desulfatibacillum aliphaticivorans]|uniref:ASKHA domain-containing protein n=1 Tax=Desulfatibacillum aliphaticivorans TaxID=218208 RepID=UPI000427B386|nr:ASKHA domain-containing protein [Desulfatibacillum aliphaticivorans]